VTNIPTELLRTLVAVVDLRSFTKAAISLGVTQPAVSAQIKRLQSLLDADLLDKSAPGVSLTSAGELVVNYARRLLSINDQILDLAMPRLAPATLRIGTTGDVMAEGISQGLARARMQQPILRFRVHADSLDALLRSLRAGELELVVWMSVTGPAQECRHSWTEDLVWVRGAGLRLDPPRPVPLVSYGDDCLFTRSATRALAEAGMDCERAFVGSSLPGVAAAVAAGIGVMALPRSRANRPGLVVWDNAPLPPLPGLAAGIYVRAGCETADPDAVADALAATLRPPGVAALPPDPNLDPIPVE
jgi:DNA-binding transcriptional LysR family regulator